MGCPSDPSQSIGHFKITKGPHGSALGTFVRLGSFMRHELKKKVFWTFMFSFQIVRLNVIVISPCKWTRV